MASLILRVFLKKLFLIHWPSTKMWIFFTSNFSFGRIFLCINTYKLGPYSFKKVPYRRGYKPMENRCVNAGVISCIHGVTPFIQKLLDFPKGQLRIASPFDRKHRGSYPHGKARHPHFDSAFSNKALHAFTSKAFCTWEFWRGRILRVFMPGWDSIEITLR